MSAAHLHSPNRLRRLPITRDYDCSWNEAKNDIELNRKEDILYLKRSITNYKILKYDIKRNIFFCILYTYFHLGDKIVLIFNPLSQRACDLGPYHQSWCAIALRRNIFLYTVFL